MLLLPHAWKEGETPFRKLRPPAYAAIAEADLRRRWLSPGEITRGAELAGTLALQTL